MGCKGVVICERKGCGKGLRAFGNTKQTDISFEEEKYEKLICLEEWCK